MYRIKNFSLRLRHRLAATLFTLRLHTLGRFTFPALQGGLDPTVQGTPATVIFSVGGVITNGIASGRTVSVEVDPTAKIVRIVDENDIPTGRFVIPQEIKAKFKAEMDSSVTPTALSASADYTVSGVAMYLDKNPKKLWQRGEIATYEFELTAFPS